MRPTLKLLDTALIERIVSEARDLLCTLGVEIHNPHVLSMLADHGAEVNPAASHARIPGALIDEALTTVPHSFKLFDVLGNETHDFAGDAVYFTPGSAAINVLDTNGSMRKPATADYIRYVKLVSGLQHIASQSTAFIPADVHSRISDSYRLYLSLLYGEKPVVTGAFTIEAFEIMRDLQLVVRGTAEELAAKPLTIFSCCPTAPIKWSDVTSQNLVKSIRVGFWHRGYGWVSSMGSQ
jgi:trimethylamine--corrinoid protein Co-methyltransferase